MTTESNDQDGADVRFPPPLVPVIGLAVGVAMHRYIMPLSLPLVGTLRYAAAALVIGAGMALLVAAFGMFRKTGQDPKPWLGTPEIISTGIYQFTRNPMYVSMGLLQGGVGIALANGWVVLLVPVTCAAIYLIAIRHEEAYLEEKFGSAYTEYKLSVRRWL